MKDENGNSPKEAENPTEDNELKIEFSTFSENPLSPISLSPDSLPGPDQNTQSPQPFDGPVEELPPIALDAPASDTPSPASSENLTGIHPISDVAPGLIDTEHNEHTRTQLGRAPKTIGESLEFRGETEEKDGEDPYPQNIYISTRATAPTAGEKPQNLRSPLPEKVSELVSELNEKAKLKLDPQLLRQQISAGRIFLPLVPRYGAVWLFQKLAEIDLEIEIRPAEVGSPSSENAELESLNSDFSLKPLDTALTPRLPSSGIPTKTRIAAEDIPLFLEGDPLAQGVLRPIHVESLIEVMDHIHPEAQQDYLVLFKVLEKELLNRAVFLNARGRTATRSKLELVRPPFLYRLSLDCQVYTDSDELP